MRVASLLLLSILHTTTTTTTTATTIDVLPSPTYNKALDHGAQGPYPTHSFKTLPTDVKAPVINFLQWSPECDDGLYYFLSPRGYSIKHKAGPMILDSRGNLVWGQHFKNRAGGEAYNFGAQKYKGEDHLTFWLGEDRVAGHGAGMYYFLNSSYDIVDIFGGANRFWADLHEFLITDDDSALMTLYDVAPMDVSMLRTFDAEDEDPNFVWDGIVQEIDLNTRKLKWQWRAKDHINITDSYRPILTDGTKGHPYDWFHINSAQKDDLGNFLLSARFPHSIMYIDGRTNRTLWTLGGKRNSFMDLSGGNATSFAWQHHARFYPVDTFPNLYTPASAPREGLTTKLLTLFDNAAENTHYDYGMPFSRGLLLELTYPTPGTPPAAAGPPDVDVGLPGETIPDAEKMRRINGSDPDYTVRVVSSYENLHLRSSSQGNMQLIPPPLPNHDPNVLLGYGLDAAWQLFAPNGSTLCEAHFAAQTSFETGKVQSYRIFKFPWTGRPRWRPKVVSQGGTLFFSWLGATDIREWIVQVSSSAEGDAGGWREVARVLKTGFEEALVLPPRLRGERFWRVVAVDGEGAWMEGGVSDVVDRGVYGGGGGVLKVAVVGVVGVVLGFFGLRWWWRRRRKAGYRLLGTSPLVDEETREA